MGLDAAFCAGAQVLVAGFSEAATTSLRAELEQTGAHVLLWPLSAAALAKVDYAVLAHRECEAFARIEEMPVELRPPCVSRVWFLRSVGLQHLLAPAPRFLPPLKAGGIPEMRAFKIALTGFVNTERLAVRELIEESGASYTATLSLQNTHLIYSLESDSSKKLQKAREWGVTCATPEWLEQCLLAWKVLPIGVETAAQPPPEEAPAAPAAPQPTFPIAEAVDEPVALELPPIHRIPTDQTPFFEPVARPELAKPVTDVVDLDPEPVEGRPQTPVAVSAQPEPLRPSPKRRRVLDDDDDPELVQIVRAASPPAPVAAAAASDLLAASDLPAASPQHPESVRVEPDPVPVPSQEPASAAPPLTKASSDADKLETLVYEYVARSTILCTPPEQIIALSAAPALTQPPRPPLFPQPVATVPPATPEPKAAPGSERAASVQLVPDRPDAPQLEPEQPVVRLETPEPAAILPTTAAPLESGTGTLTRPESAIACAQPGEPLEAAQQQAGRPRRGSGKRKIEGAEPKPAADIAAAVVLDTPKRERAAEQAAAQAAPATPFRTPARRASKVVPGSTAGGETRVDAARSPLRRVAGLFRSPARALGGGDAGDSKKLLFSLAGSDAFRTYATRVIRRLGGEVSGLRHQYDPAADFLVCDELRRTEKFLASCAAGRPILRPSFIDAAEASNTLSEALAAAHEYSGAGHVASGSIWLGSPRKWRLQAVGRGNNGAFYGQRIAICGETAPPPSVLQSVIAAGGGQALVIPLDPPVPEEIGGIDFCIVPRDWSYETAPVHLLEFLKGRSPPPPCVHGQFIVQLLSQESPLPIEAFLAWSPSSRSAKRKQAESGNTAPPKSARKNRKDTASAAANRALQELPGN
eukprot:TRINITY_DN5624_c0_g1_i1.p1 TRINITY_DN5624_c0_g1~~TRINITY_DN5624_c0_g1_i1.p1  ORF type:complete len:870 (+),score=147.44 TRINITY_DN5624_c0_g1_i1:735-3344(+)